MYLCKDIERDAYTKEQSLVIDKGDVDGGYKRVIIHKAPDEVSKGLCSQGTTSMDLVDSYGAHIRMCTHSCGVFVRTKKTFLN